MLARIGMDHRSVQFQLMCGVLGNQAITTRQVVDSFCITRMNPFQRQFVQTFLQEHQVSESTSAEPHISWDTVYKNADHCVAKKLPKLVEEESDGPRLIQRVSVLVHMHKSTNSVHISHSRTCSVVVKYNEGKKRASLCSVMAAKYVTKG